MNYGAFESFPAMFDDREAWVLFMPAEGWRKFDHCEVLLKTFAAMEYS